MGTTDLAILTPIECKTSRPDECDNTACTFYSLGSYVDGPGSASARPELLRKKWRRGNGFVHSLNLMNNWFSLANQIIGDDHVGNVACWAGLTMNMQSPVNKG